MEGVCVSPLFGKALIKSRRKHDFRGWYFLSLGGIEEATKKKTSSNVNYLHQNFTIQL